MANLRQGPICLLQELLPIDRFGSQAALPCPVLNVSFEVGSRRTTEIRIVPGSVSFALRLLLSYSAPIILFRTAKRMKAAVVEVEVALGCCAMTLYHRQTDAENIGNVLMVVTFGDELHNRLLPNR
jgi:hypothetical protein